VKLVGLVNGKLLFHLGRREKNLLLDLLKLYPRIPPAHAKLSKSGKLEASSRQLLQEALAEQRAQNQKQVAALVGDPERWIEHQGGWGLSLNSGEMEWLLQVLNDIRVGSWVLLGSPEQQIETLDEETAPHLWAMEIAGTFEIPLLQALEGPRVDS
jgi:hypothetical protein